MINILLYVLIYIIHEYHIYVYTCIYISMLLCNTTISMGTYCNNCFSVINIYLLYMCIEFFVGVLMFNFTA